MDERVSESLRSERGVERKGNEKIWREFGGEEELEVQRKDQTQKNRNRTRNFSRKDAKAQSKRDKGQNACCHFDSFGRLRINSGRNHSLLSSVRTRDKGC